MHPLAPYRDSWAIVTGACSGIGRAYADRLAAAGLHVVMISDNPPRLEAAADAIRAAHGTEVEALHIDLSLLDFENAVEDLLQTRKVRVLVSNAAFGMGGPLWTQDRSRLRKMLNLNAGAYLLLTHACAGAFVRAGEGAIVLVSSLNAASPVPMAATYTATKAFGFYLGAALWEELSGTGVKAQVVLPGPTRTDFQRVAGTQVARVAMEPERLVDLALQHLGKGPAFVPTFHHRFAFRFGPLLPLKRRIQVAGQFYRRLLHETPDIGLGKLLWRSLTKPRKRM
jgi:short-subunit dehydrogenase